VSSRPRPEVGGRDVEPGARRLDHADRCLERPEEGALDRQLDRDDVAEHVDAVQFPVDVGQERPHPDEHVAELRPAVALLAGDPADAVEHPSSAKRSMNPLTSRTSPSA
jgi:hypothetical protein